MALAMVFALGIAIPVGISLRGLRACAAATAAAAVVWGSSALALAVGELLQRTGQALASVLLSMMVRISLPLAACVIVYANGGVLAEAGFAVFILIFYLVALPLDTLLAVAHVHSPKAT